MSISTLKPRSLLYALRSLFAAVAMTLCAQEDEPQSFRAEVKYTYLNIGVGTLPESVRLVPVHKDDPGFVHNAGPVGQVSYSLDNSIAIGLDYLKEWDRGWRYRLALGLDWISPLARDEAERNYTNAAGTEQRGYGAALTYAGVQQRGVIPPFDDAADQFLNFTPTLAFELGPRQGPLRHFLAGVSLSYYAVYAINGWDRWDSNELNDSEVLAHVLPVGTYLRYCGPSHITVVIGAQFRPVIESSLGRQAALEISAVTFFATLGAEF